MNKGASSGPGSREPSPDGLGPSGFDPSRVEWHYMGGDLPQLRDDELIYALGRYGDVYGPLPYSLFNPEAWGGNMFHASHDVHAFAHCDRPWREVVPLLRDSDGSPKGGDGEAGSVRSTTARAGTASPEHRDNPPERVDEG